MVSLREESRWMAAGGGGVVNETPVDDDDDDASSVASNASTTAFPPAVGWSDEEAEDDISPPTKRRRTDAAAAVMVTPHHGARPPPRKRPAVSVINLCDTDDDDDDSVQVVAPPPPRKKRRPPPPDLEEEEKKILKCARARLRRERGTDNTLLMLVCGATVKSQQLAARLVKRAVGKEVNAVNSDGMTALMAAAWSGNYHFVGPLLRNKADLRLRTKNGSNVLHWLSGAGDCGMPFFFAEITRQKSNKRVICELLAQKCNGSEQHTPGEHAIANRHEHLAAIFDKFEKQGDLTGALPTQPIEIEDDDDDDDDDVVVHTVTQPDDDIPQKATL